MKVVYHANYFTWFEAARIELLDQMGCPYLQLEKDGFLLPVLHCEAKFHKPACFDDRLDIRAFITDEPAVRIRIFYEVCREDVVLCTGHTTHAFIDQSGKLLRPPQYFIDKAKTYFN